MTVYKFKLNEFHRRSYLIKAFVIGIFLLMLIVIGISLLHLNRFFNLGLAIWLVLFSLIIYYYHFQRIKDLQKVYKTDRTIGHAALSITSHPVLDFFNSGNVVTPQNAALKHGDYAVAIFPFFRFLFLKFYSTPFLIFKEQFLFIQNLDYERGKAIVEPFFEANKTTLKLKPVKSEYIDDFEIIVDINLEKHLNAIKQLMINQ